MRKEKDEPYVLPVEAHRRDGWHIRSDNQGYSLWFANEMRARMYGFYAAGQSDDCKAVADALNEAAALTAEIERLTRQLEAAEAWIAYQKRKLEQDEELK
jgi:hypothetical protein